MEEVCVGRSTRGVCVGRAVRGEGCARGVCVRVGGLCGEAGGCAAVWRAAQGREAARPCARSGPGGACCPRCPGRAVPTHCGWGRGAGPRRGGCRCPRPAPPHAGGLTDSAPRAGTGRAGAGREVGGGRRSGAYRPALPRLLPIHSGT